MPRQILILIKCDQCDAETDDNKTLIRLNGRNEIETDLCADHRLELETFLAPFIAKGRKPEVAATSGRGGFVACPFPDCETRAANRAGLGNHIRSKHGGLQPDGSPYAGWDSTQTPRDRPCPLCNYSGRGQLGLSIHLSRKHNKTQEEIAILNPALTAAPGPDSAGPPSAESSRRRRGPAKKVVASR